MENYIVVRIIHGSRRRTLFKNETHELFGKLGGHVAIQIHGHVYGFYYSDINDIHIFPRVNNKKCEYQKQTLAEWEAIIREKKETTVKIPVTEADVSFLLDYYNKNLEEPTHDYSFFGERCASSCYHLLKKLNIMSGGSYYFMAFYPAQFRKKLLKQAAKKGYMVSVKEGDTSRIWEGD